VLALVLPELDFIWDDTWKREKKLIDIGLFFPGYWILVLGSWIVVVFFDGYWMSERSINF
jgi:hypothetical protein